jgi:hypothetical protein
MVIGNMSRGLVKPGASLAASRSPQFAEELGAAAGHIWRESSHALARERVTKILRAWSPFGLNVYLRTDINYVPMSLSVVKGSWFGKLGIRMFDDRLEVGPMKSDERTVILGDPVKRLLGSLPHYAKGIAQERLRRIVRQHLPVLARDIESHPELYTVLRVEKSVDKEVWDIDPYG